MLKALTNREPFLVLFADRCKNVSLQMRVSIFDKYILALKVVINCPGRNPGPFGNL